MKFASPRFLIPAAIGFILHPQAADATEYHQFCMRKVGNDEERFRSSTKVKAETSEDRIKKYADMGTEAIDTDVCSISERQAKYHGKTYTVYYSDTKLTGNTGGSCYIDHENIRTTQLTPGKIEFCCRKKGTTGEFNSYNVGRQAQTEAKYYDVFKPAREKSGYEVHKVGDEIKYKGGKGVVGVDLYNPTHCKVQGYNPEAHKTCGKTGSASGDPHIALWNGNKFDFHGGCDLVMFQNPDFANGLGLQVHIRTEIETWWSYIKSAAIKVGDNILEVTTAGYDQKKISYWLDGVKVDDMETGTAALGDFAVHFRRVNDHHTQSNLNLGNGNSLSIQTFKKFIKVFAKVGDADKFAGTVGLLGTYPTGEKVARDKKTIIDDTNEFGQEWQVRPLDDGMLFHSAEGVQHPTKCLMPDQMKKSQQRRLFGEAVITEEDAAMACARVNEKDRDACIFDVMATQDTEMAGSY